MRRRSNGDAYDSGDAVTTISRGVFVVERRRPQSKGGVKRPNNLRKGNRTCTAADDTIPPNRPMPAVVSPPVAGHFVLIEDDGLLCDLLARAITARFAPRTLRTFGDGAVGLAHCLAEAPDLLITDLRLPGVDGREIIRRVRARHPGTQ